IGPRCRCARGTMSSPFVSSTRLGIRSILLGSRCREQVTGAAKSIDGGPAGRVLLQPGGINMRESIFGIVPPMTTPFWPDDTIDETALRAETRYLIETARVHGLAVGGSTGEGHALTTDEGRRITAVVTEEAPGRVPVLPGSSSERPASA